MTINQIINRLYDFYKKINNSVLNFVMKNKLVIPLSNIIIRFLNLKFGIKSIIIAIFSTFVGTAIYSIGFLSLQSKGKNELLSWTSAHHNPIEFSTTLYLMYAFIYLSLAFFPVLLFFAHIYVYEKNNELRTYFPNVKIFKNLNEPGIIFFLGVTQLICIYLLPYVPYYLLFSTKGSSPLDTIFQLTRGKNTENIYLQVGSEFSYSEFRNEIFFSIQIVNLIVCLLLFFGYKFWKYLRFINIHYEKLYKQCENTLGILESNKEKLKTYYHYLYLGSLSIIHSFKSQVVEFTTLFIFTLVATLFSLQIVFQAGSFGKNLAQFDTDFIEVKYSIPNKVESLRGFRIYQSNNLIVVRDLTSNVHHISNNYIHVKNLPLIIIPEEVTLKPGETDKVNVFFNGNRDVTNSSTFVSSNSLLEIDTEGNLIASPDIQPGEQISITASLYGNKVECIVTIK